MKHKIIKIEEPTNEVELQQVKDVKEFNNTIVKLVASTSAAMIGPTTLIGLGGNSSFSVAATALGLFLMVYCGGVVNTKLVSRLNELYNKRKMSNAVENQEIENELSGGMKR